MPDAISFHKSFCSFRIKLCQFFQVECNPLEDAVTGGCGIRLYRSQLMLLYKTKLFFAEIVVDIGFIDTAQRSKRQVYRKVCKACVAELSKLNELNDAIKSMGGEVVGINTETFDGNKTAIKEAASVLESQGVKYRNLSIDSSSAAGKYASEIMAFPTTILVDRNGNIVGEPMLGGIDNQDNYDALMKQIQSVIDADSTNK